MYSSQQLTYNLQLANCFQRIASQLSTKNLELTTQNNQHDLQLNNYNNLYSATKKDGGLRQTNTTHSIHRPTHNSQYAQTNSQLNTYKLQNLQRTSTT